MRLHQEVALEAKMQNKRRGPRMNSRVPVQIEWQEGHQGQSCLLDAVTRVVNCYGCLLVGPQPLLLEQHFVLTNLANHRSIGAVVVWKGKERVDGWELGVELIAPEMDFWGVEI